MKRLSILLLALLLVPAACGRASTAPSGHPEGHVLYFQPASYTAGAALVPQGVELSPDIPEAEALITALLSGPTEKGLLSPFPKGVTLHSWAMQEDILHVNLSEEYGSLPGMDLTLADYAIALTLCQLDGVEGVTITVENDPIPFRYRQILQPRDILLTDLPEAS